jgi:hypothetical protein
MDTIPPDDLPERDVHEDLSDGPSQSEACREAERVFARLNGQAQPSEVKDDPAPSRSPIGTPEAPAPRVLPDLLAGAREEERTMVEKPKRSRVPKAIKVKRKKTKSSGPRLEQPEPAPPPKSPPSPVRYTTIDANHLPGLIAGLERLCCLR